MAVLRIVPAHDATDENALGRAQIAKVDLMVGGSAGACCRVSYKLSLDVVLEEEGIEELVDEGFLGGR